MKHVLWTLGLSLAVTACFLACDDGSSDSLYEVPSFKREAALPDTCSMEIARVSTAYYACFENKWIEVTDSASIEQLKEGLNEEEFKALLEELEDQLVKPSSTSKKIASSSAAEELDDDDEGDVEESSSSSEESSRRRDRKSSSSAKKSHGGSEEIIEESSSSKKASSSSAKISSSSEKSSSSSAKSSSSSAKSSSSSVKSSSSVEEIVDCSGKTAKAGKQNMSVTVDGKKRTFVMSIPDSYKGNKPVPLVVDYHPVMGNGDGQYRDTKYRKLTDPEGVISLYPDGTKSSDPRKMGPGWNVGPCCSDDDDVKFSREMIAAVEEIACIDKKRVYAAGFSMGGGMANHVACFMSDVFAAVAPAGMDLNTTNSAKCNPERPISIIMFRGTADNVCKYQGGDSGYGDGLNFLGAERNFSFWAEKNGCTGSPTKNSDGCDEYSNCKDGTKVVLCTKQGGGHEQGDANIGWPFLQQFTLP